MTTITDLFCGAGGSSSGAVQVPGVLVRLAANHWKLAIETHNTNHPGTDHDCADISQVDPRRYPRTDVLWASPECTNHSVAKGVKRNRHFQPDLFGDNLPDEAAQRSRATMWDVPRFAECHRYEAIVTENVVDAYRWVMFPAWLQAMELLGYRHGVVWLNSMHAQALGLPAPQSRDRMYVVFWLAGNRAPDLQKWTRPYAVCPTHGRVQALQAFKKAERWGRYRAQYVYRCPHTECRNTVVEPGWLPAASAIDWDLKGQRIGDRTKPLAAKTRARIEAGLRRYAQPLTVAAAGNTYDSASGKGGNYFRAYPLSGTLPTQSTTVQHALVVPVEGRDGKQTQASAEPLRTMTTRNETALVVPLKRNGVARPVSEVIPTVEAGGNHHALVEVTDAAVDDCEFRMLEPHEIKRGMAFSPEYVILGNKRERVKQAGNAVTPPAARDLIAAVVESLGVAVAS